MYCIQLFSFTSARQYVYEMYEYLIILKFMNDTYMHYSTYVSESQGNTIAFR